MAMAALVAAASAVGAGPSLVVLRFGAAAGPSRDLSCSSSAFAKGAKLQQRRFRNGVGAAPLVKAQATAEVESPPTPERFRLGNLSPQPGSRKRNKRKGRGIAAGQGASCGFGMRGQKSRSGSGVRHGFEGGQMPLYRRVPKLKGIAGGWPISASSSQGFGGVFPTIRLTDNAGKIFVRSGGCGALQSMSLKCAALGNGGDVEPDVSNVAGGEVVVTDIENKDNLLVSGSPIVIVEAPVMLKTAEPMPMMRPNRGVIKPGDAGRVIDRRPKGLWAVRFAVGAYLIERKCFKPLDVQ